MGKRLFDILSSFFVLIHIWPFMLIIAMLVVFSGRGGIFFTQKRVGRNEKEFKLYKFRTMRLDSEQKGQLTVGGDDPRITKAGRFLRRFKLDELPQLLNVLALVNYEVLINTVFFAMLLYDELFLVLELLQEALDS